MRPVARFPVVAWRRLAMVAFCAAAYQSLLSRELALPLAELWPVLLAILSLSQVCFGLGAVWDRRQNSSWSERLDLALGLMVILSLVAALQLAAGRISPAWSAITAFAALSAFLLLGRRFMGEFASVARDGSGVPSAVIVAAVGTAAGFTAAGWGATALGVNAALLTLGLFLALPGRSALLCLLLLLPAVGGRLDARLEARRPASVDCNFRCSAEWLSRDFERIYGGWTSFSRLDIFANRDRDRLFGAYNYFVYWVWADPGVAPQLWLSFVKPGQKVLIIGAAGGFDAIGLPAGVSQRDVTLVEIDDGVVDFFRRNPALNDRLFERAEIVRMDGRSFLEESRGRVWDVVIVGSMDSPARNFLRHASMKSSLHTLEGVRTAIRGLAPSGILVFTPRDLASMANITRLLEVADLSWGLLAEGGRPMRGRGWTKSAASYPSDENVTHYNIYASRDRKSLEAELSYLGAAARLRKMMGRARQYSWVLLGREEVLRALTSLGGGFAADDRPFLLSLDQRWRPLLLGGASLILLSGLALAAWSWRDRESLAAYFLLIGGAYVLAQLALFARWHSFFGDPVRTTFALFLLWSGGNAVGAWWLGGRGELRLGWRSLAMTVAYTGWAWSAIPWSWSGMGGKVAAAVVLVGPAAVVAGSFLPAGLARVPTRAYARAILWDSLGAALGLLAFVMLSILWGFSSAMAVAAALYGAALLAYR